MTFMLKDYPHSFIMTTDVDKLPYLYRVLHQLASRWKSISLQLSVSGQDEIQRNARSADICLAVSLVEWLQSGQATWKALVEAVFRPAGGGHQVLATDIARNYKSEPVFCTHEYMDISRVDQTFYSPNQPLMITQRKEQLLLGVKLRLCDSISSVLTTLEYSLSTAVSSCCLCGCLNPL